MARTTTTTAAVFIPEIWMNETKAQYENKLVMLNRVKKFRHNGKAGDVLHVPQVSNLTANDFTESGELTPQAATENEFTLTINKHKEASIEIGDLARIQSRYDLRSEYTEKMGYAVRKAIEVDLMEAMMTTSSVSITQQYDADGSAVSASGGTINVAGILKAIQYLDDNDVPENDRYLIVPPSARNDLLQINQFISVDYRKRKPTDDKVLGNIFELEVIVSNNCPSDTNSKKNAIVMQKDAIAIALQREPRMMATYEHRKLSWLVSIDTIYGVALFRGDTNVVGLALA